jgi:hypothetical protein
MRLRVHCMIFAGLALSAACSSTIEDDALPTIEEPSVGVLARPGGSQVSGRRCLIDGVQYAEGSSNPANACQVCQPSIARRSWVTVDDAACVAPEEPPADAGSDVTCTPTTCAATGKNCGTIADGCGGTLTCGTCVQPEWCGGGGANVCGWTCHRKSCGDQAANCGTVDDGCGGTLDCGTCASPATCGGAGQPNVCGTPIEETCVAKTCAQLSSSCGPQTDGCGRVLNCGTCPLPTSCGGGGTASQCGGNCSLRSCGQNYCGLQSDGCGGTMQCGVCPDGQSCMGIPSRCVPSTYASGCSPKTCPQLAQTCGIHADGCGGLVDCGQCPNACVPKTCADVATTKSTVSCRAGASPASGCLCGPIADGCGGLLDCGPCAAGEACGLGGTAICGSP